MPPHKAPAITTRTLTTAGVCAHDGGGAGSYRRMVIDGACYLAAPKPKPLCHLPLTEPV
jgi:hypothetical protein